MASFVDSLAKRLKLMTLSNAKIMKSIEKGYITAGLHLSPARKSGYNTCAMHTAACAKDCLDTSGHGRWVATQAARHRRTVMFFEERKKFVGLLIKDLAVFKLAAEKQTLEPCGRLNLTQDIRWEIYGIPQAYPDMQFYDYTKIFNRKVPANYHLTYSFSGDNVDQCKQALQHGHNVAAPFLNRPANWLGFPVVDGDDDDLRFLNQGGPYIIGLKPKGSLAKNPDSPFLADNHS